MVGICWVTVIIIVAIIIIIIIILIILEIHLLDKYTSFAQV